MQNEAKVEEARRSPKVLKVSFFLQIYNPIEIEMRGPSQSTKQWKGLVTQKGESTTKATHSGANCSKMDGWYFLKKCRWWRESCLCLRRCKRAECCKLSLLSHTKEKNVFVNKYIVEYKTEQQSALPCYPGWAWLNLQCSRGGHLRCYHHCLFRALWPWPSSPASFMVIASVVVVVVVAPLMVVALIVLVVEVVLTIARRPVHLTWLAAHLHHLRLHHSRTGFI